MAVSCQDDQGSWTFDFASEDGSLALDYLTPRDGDRESFQKDVSSVWSYNLPELAQRLSSEFSTRTNGTPVTIGLFFDPLATVCIWDKEKKKLVPRPGSSFEFLSDEERKAILYEDWDKGRQLLHHDALEYLREQVRFFLDWARKEGRLPVPKQQPSADESPMEPREQP